MDKFGSVCKVMEKSETKTDGNISKNTDTEFDDKIPF